MGRSVKATQVGHTALEATGEELGVLLDRARFLLEIMRTTPPRTVEVPAADGAEAEARIAALEAEVSALELRLAAAEQQNDRLMRQYVATYQLHATLDPNEVLAAVSDIVVNLVGADRFAVILTDKPGAPGFIVLRHGFDEVLGDRNLIRFAGQHYAGGDAQVDATLADGKLRWAPAPGSPVLATIPLNMSGRTVGTIAILKLLEHREELGTEERELFDLLAAHTACALLAAQSYARAERKLQRLAGILTPTTRRKTA
jgi:GAF domain-containing protein